MNLDILNILNKLKDVKWLLNLLPVEQVREYVEGRMIIPKKVHEQITNGMSDEDKATAEQLRKALADAQCDYALFIASRGAIDPD